MCWGDNMIAIEPFEDEMASLKKTHEYGSFEYANPLSTFSSCVRSHFSRIERLGKHGVYVVHQRSTGEVLYIGKGGTIDPEGKFRKQDIPDRLTNVKAHDMSANRWFANLCQEKGPLIIEYVFLPTSKSPALVEATFLQAYLNEYHRLPCRNKEL
jgi:hypothetical protein